MIADATPPRDARAPTARWAVVLALVEGLVAYHVLGAVEHGGVNHLPLALFQASPFWVHAQARNLVVLLVLARRAFRHRGLPTGDVPLAFFVASLICLWPTFTVDAWPPDFGFLDARMVAALSLASASAAVAVASAFDLMSKSPRSRTDVALGVATLVTLVVVLRTRALQEIVAFVAHEPILRPESVVGLCLLAAFVALTIVHARRRRVRDEALGRSLEALVIALGLALLCGWTILVRWDPFFALTRGNALLWLVPVGLPALACAFAPSLRARTFRVLATWFVAWAFLVVIDRTMEVRAISYETVRQEEALYAFVGDVTHGHVYRQGRVVRVRQRFDGYPWRGWTIGDPDPGARHTRCDTQNVAIHRREGADHAPRDPRPTYAGLYLHEGATEDELAACVGALESAGFTEVAFMGRVPTPLPWWSTMHTFAHVHRPAVRVLEGPISMLRCDARDAERCSARGVIRLRTLETMATSSPSSARR